MTRNVRLNIAVMMAVVGAIGFSFKAILVKLAYRYGVDAETLLALRMSFSLPLFILLGVFGRQRLSYPPMQRQDFLWMLGLGFFGYYLASYLDFLGLAYISAGLERLILFSYPTIVLLISALFLGKPLTKKSVLSLMLCYGGISFAMSHDVDVGESGTVLIGGVLVFGSAVSYALYLLGNGMVVGRLGSVRVTAWASSIACLLSIAQFLFMQPINHLWQQSWQVYIFSLAMSLFSTVGPVWLISEAIRRLGAGPVALIGTLGPVATILLGWWLLDESFSVQQLCGTLLVIAGVIVIGRGERKLAPTPKAD